MEDAISSHHSFFCLFTFPCWHQTFLLEGEVPVLDFLGIVFGHVYYHFKKVGILRAPEGLVKWYQESDSANALRERYKEISTDL